MEKKLKTMSKTVAPKCIWIYLNSIHVIKIHLRHPPTEIFLTPFSGNKYLSPVNFANISSVNLVHVFIHSTTIQGVLIIGWHSSKWFKGISKQNKDSCLKELTF